MQEVESLRKKLNRRQADLNRLMNAHSDGQAAIQMFLQQHASLHSSLVAPSPLGSLEDLILNDLSEAQFRAIPPKGEHSIAWIIWHLARIEDIAMNLVVAGGEQVFSGDDWAERLNSPILHSGNAMPMEEVIKLSDKLDITALRAYRVAVGRRTQQITRELPPEQLKHKVDVARLPRLFEQGALIEASRGIADYWSKRTLAGLLLMPASRHLLTHLNEAIGIKKKLT